MTLAANRTPDRRPGSSAPQSTNQPAVGLGYTLSMSGMSRSELIVVTGLGTGYLRPASGTWGSMPPVILAASLLGLGLGPREIDVAMGLVGIVFAASCLISGDRAERHFGMKDPKTVVADEFAGQAVTLMWLPWEQGLTMGNCVLLVMSFFFFRLFDVLKPSPARELERLPSGIGVLLDDVAAGLYACLTTVLLWTFVLAELVKTG